MKDIKIETTIPIPQTIERRGIFPFSEMNIGDSFFLSDNFLSARASAYNYGKRTGMKFTCRQDKGKLSGRVWRIA